MPGFDSLAPDQKAVLQLLLKQGKTYDDIAGLLRLDRANVRERALDALDALGADTVSSEVVGSLSSEHQDELADHLLLQQTASQRAATRDFLDGSPAGRAWARGVASELRPIGGDALPEIPAEPAEVAEAFDALDQRTAARERQQQSSRLGGVLILLAVGAVLGLGILYLIKGGDDEESTSAASGDAATETAAAQSTGGRCALPTPRGATGPTGVTGAIALEGAATIPAQQINLNPPNGGGSKVAGVAVFQEGGLAFQVEGLADSKYGVKVWLWNSPEEAIPLGFARYAKATKSFAGAIAGLPKSVQNCGNLVLTREKSLNASQPGTVLLSGPIKKG